MTIEGLREGLRATGLEEGRNVALILHHALDNATEAEAAARAFKSPVRESMRGGRGGGLGA